MPTVGRAAKKRAAGVSGVAELRSRDFCSLPPPPPPPTPPPAPHLRGPTFLSVKCFTSVQPQPPPRAFPALLPSAVQLDCPGSFCDDEAIGHFAQGAVGSPREGTSLEGAGGEEASSAHIRGGACSWGNCMQLLLLPPLQLPGSPMQLILWGGRCMQLSHRGELLRELCKPPGHGRQGHVAARLPLQTRACLRPPPLMRAPVPLLAVVWDSTTKLGCGAATCSDGMTLVVW